MVNKEDLLLLEKLLKKSYSKRSLGPEVEYLMFSLEESSYVYDNFIKRLDQPLWLMDSISSMLNCPYEDLPLKISTAFEIDRLIMSWRLQIGK